MIRSPESSERLRRTVSAGLLGAIMLSGCGLHSKPEELVSTTVAAPPAPIKLSRPQRTPPSSPPLLEMPHRPVATVGDRNLRFAKTYLGLATEVQRRYGIPIDLTLAQASHESNYAQSLLAQKCHAFFGIKANPVGFAAWRGPVYGTPTREVLTKEQLPNYHLQSSHLRPDGRYDAMVIDGFRCYTSAHESFMDYGYYLLNRGRYTPGEFYADAHDETDATRYLQEIIDDDDGPGDPGQKSYATDPSYYRLVSERIALMHAARQAIAHS